MSTTPEVVHVEEIQLDGENTGVFEETTYFEIFPGWFNEFMDELEKSKKDRGKMMQDRENELPAKLQAVKEQLDTLTAEERRALFCCYCTSCGSDDPRCQCWNDE